MSKVCHGSGTGILSLPVPGSEIASPQDLPAHFNAGFDYDASTAIHSIPATDDVVGLRAEVQNLRRVMERIRQERSEPPPVYQEDQGF